MADFVFVHGAFQGGWVWQMAANRLRVEGHRVHTPTLPGCGYLAQHMSSEDDLHTYVESVMNYLEFENLTEVVLVAHSFSGMICGAVMMQAPERISRVVFVDAVIPESGRSFADTAGSAFLQMEEKHRMEEGKIKPWPLLIFGVAGPDSEWFASRLRPFPSKAFHTPFPGTFDPSLMAVTYIGCRQTVTPFIREMAEKARGYDWPVIEIETGHCPMVSCPAELVRNIVAGISTRVVP